MNVSHEESRKSTSFRILSVHYPGVAEQIEADFAEQAAADAFGRRYVAPADRDFRDHQPPHISAPKQPHRSHAAARLLAAKRAA